MKSRNKREGKFVGKVAFPDGAVKRLRREGFQHRHPTGLKELHRDHRKRVMRSLANQKRDELATAGMTPLEKGRYYMNKGFNLMTSQKSSLGDVFFPNMPTTEPGEAIYVNAVIGEDGEPTIEFVKGAA